MKAAICGALAIALLGACTAPAAETTPSPSPSSAPVPTASPTTATASPTATPSGLYRKVATAGTDPLLSPDGKTLVSRTSGPRGKVLVFQSLDGGVVGRIDDDRLGGQMEWLPDSSGVFVELGTPQRAAPLALASPQGKLVETGLDYAHPALSPDGKSIAAEHQEGCCVAIRTREIWLVPRSGGTPRALVTSTAPSNVAQPIALLGWDAEGALVYRDANKVMRVTVDGARSELPAPASVKGRSVVASSVSPDHSVILACAADPLSWWTIADGRVEELPKALRPAWRLRDPWCSAANEVPWYGAHQLILRDVANTLHTLEPVNGGIAPLTLVRSDALLSASGYILLATRGDDIWVMSATGGRPSGIRASAADVSVSPIANSSFFVRSGANAYVVAMIANASADPSWKKAPELQFPRPTTPDNNVRCGYVSENPIKNGEGAGAYVIGPGRTASGVMFGGLFGLPDKEVPPYGTWVCVHAIAGAPMSGFAGWVRPDDPDYIPASALVPTGFAPPAGCSYAGRPTTGSSTFEVVWRVTCGPTGDGQILSTLAPALTQQGWTACGAGLGVAIWTKDARTLTLAESSGVPTDHPTLSLRNSSDCP